MSDTTSANRRASFTGSLVAGNGGGIGGGNSINADSEIPSSRGFGMDESSMFETIEEDFSMILPSQRLSRIADEDTEEDDIIDVDSTNNNSKQPEDDSCDDTQKVSTTEKYKARTNFTAESPYFTSFCQAEVKNLKILTDTLDDITAKTRTFCKTGQLMSDASRRLALSCKLRTIDHTDSGDDDSESEQRAEQVVVEKRQAVGKEMSTMLHLLGNMLEETATAQIALCKTLEETLASTIEAFADMETRTTVMLQNESNDATDTAEQLYSKYLNGKLNFADSMGDPTSGQKNTKASIGSSFKNWSTKQIEKRRLARRDSNDDTNDRPISEKAIEAANMSLALEHIRLAQSSAELKRFQLTKHLVSIQHRRNFELVENVLNASSGLFTYCSTCVEAITSLNPQIIQIQKQQKSIRDHHSNIVLPSWDAREVTLLNVVNDAVTRVKNASAIAEAVAEGGTKAIEQQVLKVEDIETSTGVWAVPQLLAETSRYHRQTIPGVRVEGWLYKKSSGMLSLTPWTRRWFLMDKDSIYFFRPDTASQRGNKSSGNKNITRFSRVKICDILLCTVREVDPDTPQQQAGGGNNNSSGGTNVRFSFQIHTPTEKPITLQARGPIEYAMWVNGIRAAIESQLVSRNINEFKQNDTGKKKYERMSISDFNDFSTGDNSTNNDGSISNNSDTIQNSAMVQEIMALNPYCADCTMAQPDWVSLNLGVLICIQCSAVHRSLGVHLSKVRSLKLDALSQGEAQLFLALGNDKANSIWEQSMATQKGWTKPHPDVDRKTREEWIKSKYMWKGFLSFDDVTALNEKERQNKYDHDLYVAAKNCNVHQIANALAHGGNVDYVNPNEDGRTPLHACVLAMKQQPQDDDNDNTATTTTTNSGWFAIEAAELLLQNGAKMSAKDAKLHDVLDSAVIGNADVSIVEYLSHRSMEK
jgi:Putative GTPase activating protein for Arf/PH domain